MPNRSISQFPDAGALVDGDVFPIVRALVNYKVELANMPQPIQTAQVTIPAAQVLTLNATPFLVVPAVATGEAIAIQGGLVEFANGSANYAANTTLMLISATATGNAVRVANISNRTLPNAFITPATFSPAPMKEADGISAQVLTGNPTTGNSDLTITVFYTVVNV